MIRAGNKFTIAKHFQACIIAGALVTGIETNPPDIGVSNTHRCQAIGIKEQWLGTGDEGR